MATFMGIDQALLHIKTSGGEPFTLRFVRASGKRRGSIKIVRCIYGAPIPKDVKKTSKKNVASRIGQNQRFKENGQIPLTDVESGMLITPLISHIIGYNEFKIKH